MRAPFGFSQGQIAADGTGRGTARYCAAAGRPPRAATLVGQTIPSCAGDSAKGFAMSVLISILITFLVVILVLYLVNMLPIDGRAKQIVRVIVIIIGVLSLLRYLAVF
jgi:hypothetical protein